MKPRKPEVGDAIEYISPVDATTELGIVTELLSEQFVFKNSNGWERIVRYDSDAWRYYQND